MDAMMQRSFSTFSPVSNPTNPYQSVLPWLDRVRNAVTKRPVSERCNELAQLINEAIANSSKDLLACFIIICESCFGLRSTSALESDWGLKTVTRNSVSIFDFDRLISFFSPDGPFFKLLEIVSRETLSICELPIDKLPLCVRQSLDQAVLPAFFVDKYLPNSTVLHLKPLEFFLFAFISYLQSDSLSTQYSSDSGNVVNTAIVPIFESCLTYFVPTSAEVQPVSRGEVTTNSIWESLSSKTSNLLHLNPTTPALNFQTPPKPSLIKAQIRETAFLSPAALNTGHDPDAAAALNYKCRAFISIFSELMLTVPTVKPATPHRLSPLSFRSQVQVTSDQVRYVRSFVKHVHTFAHSCPSEDAMRDPQYKLGATSLDDMKRTVWSSEMNLQCRLYNYLKFCFETWPSDASFRMPIETWLSYIQPWRYKQSSHGRDDDEDNDHRNEEAIGKEWLPFLANNLPFYTNMFVQVVSRLTRFDLVSFKNSVMIFRITKVYAASRLSVLIVESEDLLRDRGHSLRSPNSNRKSYLPSTRSSSTESPTLLTHLIKHNYHDNEEMESELISFFCEKSQKSVRDLHMQIQVAKGILVQEQNNIRIVSQQSKKSCGIMGFLNSLIDPDEEQLDDISKSLNELKKAESHLNTSLVRLENIFGVDTFANQCLEDQLDSEIRKRRLSTPSSAKKPSPQVMLSPSGTTVLSPTGRTQVLNRLAKSDITFEGNPDLQTTRTYEIDFVVKIMISLSALINSRLGFLMQQHYSSGSLISKLLQIILSPPVSYIKVSKGSPMGAIERSVQHLPARVNLRSLADKRYIFFLCFLFSMTFFVGLGPIYLSSYALMALFFYTLVSFVWDKLKSL